MKVAFVTVGRSDWSIYLPIFDALSRVRDCVPIVVAGGEAAKLFRRAGPSSPGRDLPVVTRVRMSLTSDSGLGVAESIARGVSGFARTFRRLKPDWILLAGDRFEMLAAAVAAAPLKIPVAHLHGGESSEGALDDSFRHAITKLSHLHFVSAHQHAQRVLQLGEEEWRVVLCGAPALEYAKKQCRSFSHDFLKSRFLVNLSPPPALVTYHPETLSANPVEKDFGEVLAALGGVSRPLIFTAPNADEGSGTIRRMIRQFVLRHENAQFVESFGPCYYRMMASSAVMLGNSSSGIIEAASFGLPVVDIGDRQRGRLRGLNVINCPPDRHAIRRALSAATSEEFVARAKKSPNPYAPLGSNSSKIVVQALKDLGKCNHLINKKFLTMKVLGA